MASDPAKPADELSPAAVRGLFIVQGPVLVVPGLLLWHWSGRELADFVRFSWGEALTGVLIAGGFILSAFLLWRIFPRIGEQLTRLQAPNFAVLGAKLGWPAIVLISLSAGIGEEALFRGGLLTWLGDYLGIVPAILLSSAAFAAMHMARPVITALLFVIGVIFGVLYWQTGSLLAVMIGHALYDIWALRYLHREMHRLGLFDELEPAPEPEPGTEPAPLVNSPDPG